MRGEKVEIGKRQDLTPVILTVQGAQDHTETLRCTPNHPFWVADPESGGNWLAAEHLNPGDRLELADGSAATLTGKQTLAEPEAVYNFEVEDFHTYYVGELGVWVHNTNCAMGVEGSVSGLSDSTSDSIAYLGKRAPKLIRPTTSADLLPSELQSGRYGDLIDSGVIGDNITPHHMPGATYMERRFGVPRDQSLALNMEQPDAGGRHRRTESYGRGAFDDESPRDALARDVWDARRIYMQDGLYGPEVRNALRQYIQQSKALYPGIFGK